MDIMLSLNIDNDSLDESFYASSQSESDDTVITDPDLARAYISTSGSVSEQLPIEMPWIESKDGEKWFQNTVYIERRTPGENTSKAKRDRMAFGIIVMVLTLFSNDAKSLSVFEIKIALQPKECSSFTNHVNHSITDPNVVYPRGISDKVNYEYVITTPNYPEKYPTNLQCITLIKAPNLDYKIMIEIREKFELEPAKDCSSDFLEINDGPYGFSKRLGKFCDFETVPKELSSTGPFLWLRFKSDSNLAHTGFKIVYRFIKQLVIPTLHYCYKQTIIPDDDSFNLNTSFVRSHLNNSTKFDENTNIPVECVFDFYVNPNFSTFIHRSKFARSKNSQYCDDSFLEIFHKNTIPVESNPRKTSDYNKVCIDKDFEERIYSNSLRTLIRISVKDLSKLIDFQLTIIPLKYSQKNCSENYSFCKKHYCISTKSCTNDLMCPMKKNNRCGGGKTEENKNSVSNTTTNNLPNPKMSDEEIAKNRTNKTHAIILSSITVILIICMVICLVITIHSKKKDRCKNRIHLSEFDNNIQHLSENKRLFYGPMVTSLSTDKLSRKDYGNNSIWSKRLITEDTVVGGNINHDSILKLNGGITTDTAIITFSHKPPKMNADKLKNSSMNKIGKYLSVPYPSKSDCTQTSTNSNQFSNQNQSFGIMSPSDDFQSMSSHSCSKPNSSNNRSIHQHIQRASSMGSGLRKQLMEPVKNDNQYTKNIEWYCGPVIRGSSIESSYCKDSGQIESSDMLNFYSAKSSAHVPGCRSLPNVNYIGLQNQVYYTNPVLINNINNDVTDSLDFSYDDNSSYKEEAVSVRNHYIRDNSHRQYKSKRNHDDFSSNYGFKYFCAHEPSRSKDFVEYIA